MTRSTRRLVVGAIAVLLVCFALAAVAWLLLNRSTPGTTVTNGQLLKVIGVWKGQHGVNMEIRSDGTVRTRMVDDESNGVHFFRYRMRGNDFLLEDTGRSNAMVQRLRQMVAGVATDHFQIVTLNESELHLHDPQSGSSLRFERSEDPILSAAP